jgi:hypothetical protein
VGAHGPVGTDDHVERAVVGHAVGHVDACRPWVGFRSAASLHFHSSVNDGAKGKGVGAGGGREGVTQLQVAKQYS